MSMAETVNGIRHIFSRYERRRHIRGLEVEWNRIYESNPNLCPYQSYAFNMAARGVSRFSPRRYKLTPVFFVFFGSGDEVRLIAPLYVKRGRSGKKVFLFSDFMPAGYSDLIYPSDLTQQEFDQALSLIGKELGNPKFVLRKVNQESQLNRFLRQSCVCDLVDISQWTCVEIPVLSSYDEYWKSLSKSTRQTVRTGKNRLAKDGYDWQVRVFRKKPLSGKIVQTAMDIYFKRYSQRGNRGIRSKLLAFSKRHLNPVTRALRRSEESFYAVLEIGGVPAAFCAGFERLSGRIIIPFLSIDCDWSRYSPGGLLITEIMERLHEANEHTSLDLSRGGEEYKYRYGGKEHFNFNYEFRIRKENKQSE